MSNTRLSNDQVLSKIEEQINITRSDVIQAKLYLQRGLGRTDHNGEINLRHLVEAYSTTDLPGELTVRGTHLESDLRTVLKVVQARAACVQAIHEMVASAHIHPVSETGQGRVHFHFYPVPNTHTRLFLNRPALRYPERVIPSPMTGRPPPRDSDLFLAHLNVPTLDDGITEALAESVKCFRNDMYTPCLAMLGSAVEGMFELLKDAINIHSLNTAKKLQKPMKFGPMIDEVLRVINDAAEFKEVRKTLPEKSALDQAQLWAHQVRGARNVLHWSVTGWVPNTYEKASILLLSVTESLSILERVRQGILALDQGGATS